MSERVEGILVLPQGLARGVLWHGAAIERIDAEPAAVAGPAYRALVEAVSSGEAPLIAPGFVDAHVHGGGGADTMDGAAGVRTLAAFHLNHGTTTLLPTTITRPWPEVLRALAGVRAVMEAGRGGTGGDGKKAGGDKAGGEKAGDGTVGDGTVGDAAPLPDLPGAHLEGPFISRERLGAQPDATLAPTPERVDEVLGLGVVRVVTLAPEVDGAVEAARRFARAGVRVSIGHTAAGYDVVRAVIEAVLSEGGTVGFTHLYNAMSQLGSRAPGAVGAALAEPAAFAELILDGHHVHVAAFRAAAAAKGERLHLVTDAIRATGQGSGDSELGGRRVHVEDGAARLAGGALAGSVLTLDRAFAHAVEAGVSIGAASVMTSTAAARYLGLGDRGQLAPGLRADLVVMDGRWHVRSVIAGGRRLEVAG